jgi:DNA-binding beta-propeller fold protein YncE
MGTNMGALTFPRAVATTSRGEVWVSEFGPMERIQKFTRCGSNVVMCVGRAGAGPGEFNRAEGVAVDREDRLYVADSCNHRVQVFSADGTFLRAYGGPGSGPGQMSYPYDVRVDAAGYQFVCEFGNSRVQVFDGDGKLVEVLGRAGRRPGQFANPWSVALDSKGNLYVADSQNHRVQRFVRRAAAVPSGS